MLKLRRFDGPIAGVLIACGSLGSFAKADEPAETVRHDAMNWTFATAVSGNQVVGFLGWVNATEAVLGNIKVMWFEREDDGRWTSWAWPDNDLGTSVNSVRTLLNDQSIFAKDVDLVEAANASLAQGFKMPEPVIKGLYADDALQGIIASSENPDVLVEFLADAGWPVGKTLSAELVKADKECQGALKTPLDATMDHFAKDSELALFGTSTTEDPCADTGFCGCNKRTSTIPGTWTLVRSTPRSIGGYKCEWSRTPTVDTWYVGQTYWLCDPCPARSSAPGTTETKTTYSSPDEDCNQPSADPN